MSPTNHMQGSTPASGATAEVGLGDLGAVRHVSGVIRSHCLRVHTSCNEAMIMNCTVIQVNHTYSVDLSCNKAFNR